jgi:hypothetical protein
MALDVSDMERTTKAIKGVVGKCLTIGGLVKPRTLKQKARAFLRWRRQYGR